MVYALMCSSFSAFRGDYLATLTYKCIALALGGYEFLALGTLEKSNESSLLGVVPHSGKAFIIKSLALKRWC